MICISLQLVSMCIHIDQWNVKKVYPIISSIIQEWKAFSNICVSCLMLAFNIYCVVCYYSVLFTLCFAWITSFIHTMNPRPGNYVSDCDSGSVYGISNSVNLVRQCVWCVLFDVAILNWSM